MTARIPKTKATKSALQDELGRLMGTKPQPRPVHHCACGDHAFSALASWGVTLVSPEDAYFLTERAWHEHPAGKTVYASASINGKRVYLHREILKPAKGIDSDHVHGWGLDNRRPEIRRLSRADNNRNRHHGKMSSSGYRGVTFHRFSGLWHAYYTDGGKAVSLRYFKTAEEAARVRDAAVKMRFSGIQTLNFKEENV